MKKNWEYRDEAIELLGKAGLSDWQVGELEQLGYFEAPASKSHHLSFRGGLMMHGINVTKRLVEITEKFGIVWPRKESPYLVGMLHDLVKCKSYRAVSGAGRNGTEAGRNGTGSGLDGVETWEHERIGLPGHGEASVLLATTELKLLLCRAEVAAIVWHMGAFGLEGQRLKEYDKALEEWPREILAAHTADMIAARIDEMGVYND